MGFPLVTKAEAYYPRPDKLVSASASQTHYLMAALIVSAFVIILVVLALVFLLHRAKRAGLNLKHSRLMGSPDHTTMESSHAQTTPGGSVSLLWSRLHCMIIIFRWTICQLVGKLAWELQACQFYHLSPAFKI